MIATHRLIPRFAGLPAILALTGVLALAACNEGPAGPGEGTPTDVGVVLNSVERSLTVYPVDSPEDARTIGLGPDGTPVGFAVRGHRALVPMGTYPYAVLVDLEAGEILETIPLPENSGATGAAFLGENLALVGNPNRNTVSVVSLVSADGDAEIDVGGYPHEIIVISDLAFVVNAELENFTPTGPGTISVIDRNTMLVIRTIEVSGTNPGPIALGPHDERLYILNSGTFGEGDASLSVVEPREQGGVEIAHYDGFGDLPGTLAFDQDNELYVGSFNYGVAVWDPADERFVRSPPNAIQPGGTPAVSDVAVDPRGRMHVVKPGDCVEPSVVLRLNLADEVVETIPVGVCPTELHFARILWQE